MNRQVYEFIRHHAGYVVGENAKGALRTAKLVEIAQNAELTVKWEFEQEYWNEFRDDGTTPKRWAQLIENGTIEVFHAYVEGPCGDILASLGGITLHVDDENGRRLYEYQLLAEAAAELLKGE
jgi:hypothetical protein